MEMSFTTMGCACVLCHSVTVSDYSNQSNCTTCLLLSNGSTLTLLRLSQGHEADVSTPNLLHRGQSMDVTSPPLNEDRRL
jgi:hypothetical protein